MHDAKHTTKAHHTIVHQYQQLFSLFTRKELKKRKKQAVTAAYSSPSQNSFILFSLCFLHVSLCTIGFALNIRYTRQDLIDIVTSIRHLFRGTFITCTIPDYIARPPGSPWIVIKTRWWRRRRRERKQKWGRRSGVLLRLKNQPYKPPLPSLCL